MLGAAGVEADVDTAHAAQWSPDGRLLAFGLEVSQGACSYPHVGVAVAAPGAKPRVLVEPTSRALVAYAWSADGRLAVDREADFTSDKRGKRHPWPKRVASDYHMVSRAGDAAIRRAMLRVARSLKAGAERELVLARMRRDMARVGTTTTRWRTRSFATRSAWNSTRGFARPASRASSPPTSSCAEAVPLRRRPARADRGPGRR